VLLLEDFARPLLVAHAVLGAATVAVTTHFFLWMRKWVGGRGRGPGVRWFAVVASALYLSQFALGNLIYPVYKVHVRAQYLDLPPAVAAEQVARKQAAELIVGQAGLPATVRPPPSTAAVARLFDVKEHWAALGLPLLLVAAALAFRWDPKRDPSPATRWLLLVTSGGAALMAWAAALIGIYVSAIRAIS